MPRKLPDLLVYANPWHGPLDHNHRACTAYPWDPKDNPGRGHVGAHHRLDEDGELYFEFDQYEGTHGAILAALPKETSAEDRKKAAQALIDESPDDLVLRAKHEPVRLPNTLHYLKGIQSGALIAADLATYQTANGHSAHFQPIEKLAPSLAAQRFEAHEFHFQEKADPKPRPAHGAGRLGMAHSHRPLNERPQSAVIGAPLGTPHATDPKAVTAFPAAAESALKGAIEANAANAKKGSSSPPATPALITNDAPKGQ